MEPFVIETLGIFTMWRIVQDVGRNLGRTNQDVSPWSQILEDNWYNSPEDLADTSPEELSSLGLPLRFAKDLLKAAQSSSGRSESGGGGDGVTTWSTLISIC